MVSPAQPPQPPMWYWTARGMKMQPNKITKPLVQGINRAGDDLVVRLKVMTEALGIRYQRDASKRLRAYLDKPLTWAAAQAMFETGMIPVLYSWESQEKFFPKDYEEDQKDFLELRIRALQGEFGPELQAEVQSYEETLDALGL